MRDVVVIGLITEETRLCKGVNPPSCSTLRGNWKPLGLRSRGYASSNLVGGSKFC